MTNSPPTLTYTLEEVLARFEQRMDRQFAEVNQKIDRQSAEVNQKFGEVNHKLEEVNQKIDRQAIQVNQKFEEVNLKIDRQSADAYQGFKSMEITQAVLSEKMSGIDKRIDVQEFINRGVTISLIVALIGGAARLLGFPPKV